MKYLLSLTLLLSANAFAIDFQKVTGSFDVKDSQSSSEDLVAHAAYGSFDAKANLERLPASAHVKSDKKETSSVTELTGTFE